MGKLMTAAVIAGALSVTPIAFASTQTAQPAPAKNTASKSAVATKSTSGVVKSMDDTTLVISKPGKKGAADETFTLNPSTQKEGNVQVGSTVSVHYKTEGQSKVATAIMAHEPKAQAAHKPAAKK